MHLLDFGILAAILVLAFFAVRYSIKHKDKCCGNCSGCKAACQRQACTKLDANRK